MTYQNGLPEPEFNLPYGVRTADLPGNRPSDEAFEKALDSFECDESEIIAICQDNRNYCDHSGWRDSTSDNNEEPTFAGCMVEIVTEYDSRGKGDVMNCKDMAKAIDAVVDSLLDGSNDPRNEPEWREDR